MLTHGGCGWWLFFLKCPDGTESTGEMGRNCGWHMNMTRSFLAVLVTSEGKLRGPHCVCVRARMYTHMHPLEMSGLLRCNLCKVKIIFLKYVVYVWKT